MGALADVLAAVRIAAGRPIRIDEVFLVPSLRVGALTPRIPGESLRIGGEGRAAGLSSSAVERDRPSP